MEMDDRSAQAQSQENSLSDYEYANAMLPILESERT
jgi:hypothetical protein